MGSIQALSRRRVLPLIGVLLCVGVLTGVAASRAKAQSSVNCTDAGAFCIPDGRFSYNLVASGSECSWTATATWGDNRSDQRTFRSSTTFSHQYEDVGVFRVRFKGSGTSSNPEVTCVPFEIIARVQVPIDNSFTQNFGCARPICTRITKSREQELLRLRDGLERLSVEGASQFLPGPSSLLPKGGGDVWTAVNLGGAAVARSQIERINEILAGSVVVPDGSPNAIGPRGEGSRGGLNRLQSAPEPLRRVQRKAGKRRKAAGKALKAVTKNLRSALKEREAFYTELGGTIAQLAAGNVAGYYATLAGAQGKATKLGKLLKKQFRLRRKAARALKRGKVGRLSRKQARAAIRKSQRGKLPARLVKQLRKLGVSEEDAAAELANTPVGQLVRPLHKVIANRSIKRLLRKERKAVASAAAGIPPAVSLTGPMVDPPANPAFERVTGLP